jgi:hypothetical protein
MSALILTNKSTDAAGKLPPSTCKQQGSTMVTCTAPYAGITGVVFHTYPNLKATYAAYMAKVEELNSGQFKQNFNDCESQDTFGEVGWNHQFQHPKTYTVDQMSMGMVTDDQAAGRVFCNYTQGLEYMVWTQDDGHLMAYVGRPGPRRRVELVGGYPPQHRHRRLADEHEHAHVLVLVPFYEPRVPVRVHEQHEWMTTAAPARKPG